MLSKTKQPKIIRRGDKPRPFIFTKDKMKKFILLASWFLGVILINAQENSLQINGCTNVNKFKCANYDFYFDNNKPSFTANDLPKIKLLVKDFDCGNGTMTKDFQKTLNATQYPNLHIKFLNFSKKENNKYIATVEVKMMTKTVKYTIDFVSSKNRLIGQETVKFSDFGIVPPKKMGGMIVVKDHLNLVFNMALTN